MVPASRNYYWELLLSPGVVGDQGNRVTPSRLLTQREKWSGDVPFTGCCRTLAAVAALCPCTDRKPVLGRCLCGRHAGSTAAGCVAARRAPRSARRPVPPVHPDLEFGLDQRQERRDAVAATFRAAAVQHHAAAAAGLPAVVAGGFFGGGGRLHP